MAKSAPRFVNLQPQSVGVIGPNGRRVLVHPYQELGTQSEKKDNSVYVVEGEHYASQVHPWGSLHPHPNPDQPTAETPAVVAPNPAADSSVDPAESARAPLGDSDDAGDDGVAGAGAAGAAPAATSGTGSSAASVDSKPDASKPVVKPSLKPSLKPKK